MDVYWNDPARDQLEEIRAFIAQRQSPEAADRLIDRLTNRSRQLADFPESGPHLYGSNPLGIRLLSEGPYRIVYVIIRGNVEVLGVIHARRDLFGR